MYEHGVTGTTAPLLLILSMQFFSISWPGRLGFPESVYWFPGPVILSHAAPIRALTVMCEHRSNALPSTGGTAKLTSSFNVANCAESM